MSYPIVPLVSSDAGYVTVQVESKRSSRGREWTTNGELASFASSSSIGSVKRQGIDESVWARHLLEWATLGDVLAFGSTSKAHREIARSQLVWEFLLARDLLPLRLSPAEGRALYTFIAEPAQAPVVQDDFLLCMDALFAASKVAPHLVAGCLHGPPRRTVEEVKRYIPFTVARQLAVTTPANQVRART